MALKLPDSAVPMGDFPVAKAVDIDFDDGKNLQEKFDNGELGGGGRTIMYTSLEALGLTVPVTVGEIFNAMPDKTMAVIACEGKEGNTDGVGVHVSDVPISYGVLTIIKNEKGRFSIEYQNSLQDSPCDVKRWIGTLKGADGTGLYWKIMSGSTVSDVENKDVTSSLDTTVANVDCIAYTVKNGICYVRINNLRPLVGCNETVILPNGTLPKVSTSLCYANISTWSEAAASTILLRPNTNGSLVLWCNSNALNKLHYGMFSYPVAE